MSDQWAFYHRCAHNQPTQNKTSQHTHHINITSSGTVITENVVVINISCDA